MAVTCHNIINGKLNWHLLQTTRLQERHTAEHLGAALSNCFEEWGLLGKVVVMVTDNGANIKKAVKDCLFLEHHPCVAHTLNLCVNDGLKKLADIREVIEQSRKIVNFFKNSVLASDKLEQNQINAGLKPLKLKKDVVTRWNSQLIMFRRLIEVRASLTKTLTDLNKTFLQLTEHEWNILGDAVQILDPFELITKELSGEKFVTASLIIPLIEGLSFAIKSSMPKTDVGRSLKKLYEDDIIPQRFVFIYEKSYLLMATALDPRFKLKGIESELHKVLARQYLMNELDAILHNDQSEDSASSSGPATATPSTSSIWQRFENVRNQHNTNASLNETAERILDNYFELHLEDRKVDPILWWQQKSLAMPHLFKLSKKVLMIPATSVPSERIFSKAGLLCNDRRNRLTPKHVNEILFLNLNL